MHYLGGKEHSDRNYILKDLPEGYVLWEHVKYNKNKLEAEQKKDKGKHAAGAYERQDTYLYGHPHGRKKRYRSPADFFPHVLWLSTDEDGDPRNCSCKICSPFGEDDLQDDTTRQNSGSTVVKKENTPTASIPQLKKETNKASTPASQYLVQPLSHPITHPAAQINDQESIRPWLAWSVRKPPLPQSTVFFMTMYLGIVSFEAIMVEEITKLTVVSWLRKLLTEAILFFDRIEKSSGFTWRSTLQGMFLGAEKIWVGEPVRLRVEGDSIVVLVIQKLIEPRRGLGDIKGRWYETRLLLPVLRGLEAYQLGIGRGETSDASLWMNGRGDTIGGTGKRQKNRRMTLDIDQFMDLDAVGTSSGYNV
ncbi:hypothetical protein EYC84_000520 [Monilinia fructicola]|uniref:Cryptic loci regulator 2 N-terminal domain-containing protein n=1 Tax=Monilinia fructicola TaxID=38448 RepID=A0A5M9JTQ5_MONFR|nr:hypothetical protein EYC84_000520 [Monilinia fructicola]